MAHIAQLIIPRLISQTILEESRQESIEIVKNHSQPKKNRVPLIHQSRTSPNAIQKSQQ